MMALIRRGILQHNYSRGITPKSLFTACDFLRYIFRSFVDVIFFLVNEDCNISEDFKEVAVVPWCRKKEISTTGR
jgi:hypothetical protein